MISDMMVLDMKLSWEQNIQLTRALVYNLMNNE